MNLFSKLFFLYFFHKGILALKENYEYYFCMFLTKLNEPLQYFNTVDCGLLTLVGLLLSTWHIFTNETACSTKLSGLK